MTYERFEEIMFGAVEKKDAFFAEEIDRVWHIDKKTLNNDRRKGLIRAEGKVKRNYFYAGKETHRYINEQIAKTA